MSRLLIPDGVGMTAIAATQDRWIESTRSDRLFDDPLAGCFIEAVKKALPPRHVLSFIRNGVSLGDLLPDLSGYVVLRTCFFDERALLANRSGCKQVVILGAGLDTRAYRLPWSSDTTLFEVDTPQMVAFKEALVAKEQATPRCHRVSVAADLRGRWMDALRSSGFVGGVPTFWLAEAIFVYLPIEVVHSLMKEISESSAPGSSFAIEYAYESALGGIPMARGRQALEQNDASFMSAVDDPCGLFGQSSWAATMDDPVVRSQKVNRAVPPIVDSTGTKQASFWMATGVK
jgi:methyltransferase (TIGR00027 family)